MKDNRTPWYLIEVHSWWAQVLIVIATFAWIGYVASWHDTRLGSDFGMSMPAFVLSMFVGIAVLFGGLAAAWYVLDAVLRGIGGFLNRHPGFTVWCIFIAFTAVFAGGSIMLFGWHPQPWAWPFVIVGLIAYVIGYCHGEIGGRGRK